MPSLLRFAQDVWPIPKLGQIFVTRYHDVREVFLNDAAFGYSLHTCFGIHINKAVLPQILKPLLQRPNLRRPPGRAGHLSKRGPFAERLEVLYD